MSPPPVGEESVIAQVIVRVSEGDTGHHTVEEVALICLPDKTRPTGLIDVDLDRGHRARFLARCATRRRPMSLLSGSTASIV